MVNNTTIKYSQDMFLITCNRHNTYIVSGYINLQKTVKITYTSCKL